MGNTLPNCDQPGHPRCSHWSHMLSPGFVDSLERLSRYYGEDLCYWSMQTLPPPSREVYNITLQDAQTILRMGGFANDGWHNLTGNGVVEGGTSTAGDLCNRLLCQHGDLKGERCDPKVLSSGMPVPAAITMMRIGAAQAAAVKANYTAWTTLGDSHGDHAGNIQWGRSSGWGNTGEIRFKVMKCADIPPEFGRGTKHLHADYITPEGENFLARNIK